MDQNNLMESFQLHNRLNLSSQSLSVSHIRRSTSSLKSERSISLPPDFRRNFNYMDLIEAFQHYYTSLPITICPEKSLIIMKDMYKSKKNMPTKVIAPDGCIPNSKIRLKLKPKEPNDTPAEMQLVKRYLSNEKTMRRLSLIASGKDIGLLRVITSNKLPVAVEKVRTELVTNAAIEVEPQRDETERVAKTARLHQIAKQVTKQTIQQIFEKKIQENLGKIEATRKAIAEEVAEAQQIKIEMEHKAAQQEDDLTVRLGQIDDKTIRRKKEEERGRILPADIVKTYLHEMTEEWGTLTKVMDLFHDIVKKDTSAIEVLDKYFKSRNVRVGMINSILSPTWSFLYLTSLLGGPRTLMEHIDTMLNPETTVDVMHGVKLQFVAFLGDKQRLELFLHGFKATRDILVNYLTSQGMHRKEAETIIYEAICENINAKHKMTIALNITDPHELIEAIKMCDDKKVKSLIDQTIKMSKSPSNGTPTDMRYMNTSEKQERSGTKLTTYTTGDLSVTLKPITTTTGNEDEKKKLLTSTAQLQAEGTKQVKIKAPPNVKTTSKEIVSQEEKKTQKKVKIMGKKEEKITEKADHITSKLSRKQISVNKHATKEVMKERQVSEKYDKLPAISKANKLAVENQRKTNHKKLSGIFIQNAEEEELQAVCSQKESKKAEENKEVREESYFNESSVDDFERRLATQSEGIDRSDEKQEETEEEDEGVAQEADEEFLQGNAIRFEADFNNPDELIKIDVIMPTSMTQEKYLRELVKADWYPGKPKNMKKETIVKDLLKHLISIYDWNDLREAEIAIIILKS
ncbi:unnamed protein product [Heterobilharzia americana]|nr:unnamed protein product [Heterobilharzia americana]